MAIVFSPTVLKTKTELLAALKRGDIKSSKYNALDEDQKLFVEMVCFGNFSATQAMKAIKPHLKSPHSAGNRMAHHPAVIDVMEELTYKRDKLWMAQITGKREMALNVMEYVMKTTEDEALKVAAAKEIFKAADMAIKQNTKKDDDTITGIKLDISFSGGGQPAADIIDGEFSESDEVIVVDKAKDEGSGMPYSLDYAENINESYEKKD